VDRCALFVDAGYLLSDGASAVHGTGRRDAVAWDYPGLVAFLTELARDQSALPVLRCYWYEVTVDSRRTPEHEVLADLPGLKLRLGTMRPGRREGVEAEIHRDLSTLARNRAITDAVVLCGEDDLARVVAEVQDLGIRVLLVSIAAGNEATSRLLRQECDGVTEVPAAALRPFVRLASEAAAQNEDQPRRADSGPGYGTGAAAGAGSGSPAVTKPEASAGSESGSGTGARTMAGAGAGAASDSGAGAGRREESSLPASASRSSGAPGAGAASPYRSGPQVPVSGPVPGSLSGPGRWPAAAPQHALPPPRPLADPPSAPRPAGYPRYAQPGAAARPASGAPKFGPGQDRGNPQNPQNGPPQNGMPGSSLPASGPQDRRPDELPPGDPPRNGLRPGAPPRNGPSENGPDFVANSSAQNGSTWNGAPRNGPAQRGQALHGQVPPGPAQNGFAPNGQPETDAARGYSYLSRTNPASSDLDRTGRLGDAPSPTGAPDGGFYGAPAPYQQSPAGRFGSAADRAMQPQVAAPPSAGRGSSAYRPDGYLVPAQNPYPDSGAGQELLQSQSIPPATVTQAAHAEGYQFGDGVAREAPALWLEAVLARKPRMPSDLETRMLQGSSLPIDSLLHDEIRHALRQGFWDALERPRR